MEEKTYLQKAQEVLAEWEAGTDGTLNVVQTYAIIELVEQMQNIARSLRRIDTDLDSIEGRIR